MNDPKPKSFLSKLHDPMAAPAYYRRTGYAYLALAAFVAVTGLVLRALAIADTLGMMFLLIFALLASGPGLWRLWKSKRVGPDVVVHTTLATMPPTAQEAILRRQIPLAAVAFPLLSIMTAHSLLQLERGEARSVRVWAPLALLYNTLGFWPAVLFVPCLGVALVVGLVKRQQKLREARESHSAESSASPKS